ncbi:hypothetical protein Tco_0817183 [Tanacetum coccineum]
MSMSVQKSQQVHKLVKFQMAKRLCLVDDSSMLKYHNVKYKFQGTSSYTEINDHYNIFTMRKCQEYELKNKDEELLRSLLQESKDREANLQGELSEFKPKNVKALDLEQVVESKSSEIDVLKSKVDLLE